MVAGGRSICAVGMNPADFMGPEQRRKDMKVRIDYDLCMGDRNCNKVCPEVFQYDEDKLISRVLAEVVPRHLEKAVRKAARECAPGAIVVEE